MSYSEHFPYGELPYSREIKLSMQQDIVKAGLLQLALAKPQHDRMNRRAVLFRIPYQASASLMPQHVLLCADDTRLFVAGEIEKILRGKHQFGLEVFQFHADGKLEGQGKKTKIVTISDIAKFALTPNTAPITIENFEAYVSSIGSRLERTTEVIQMVVDLIKRNDAFNFLMEDAQLSRFHRVISHLTGEHRQYEGEADQFFKRWCNKV